MTTSEPEKQYSNGHSVTPNEIRLPSHTDLGFGQFLDVAELTRLANEFMSGGHSDPVSGVPSSTELARLANSHESVVAGISEDELSRLPLDLARSAAVSMPGTSTASMPGLSTASMPGASTASIPGASTDPTAMISSVTPLAPNLSMVSSPEMFDANQLSSEFTLGFLNGIRPMLGLSESSLISSTSLPNSGSLAGANQLVDYGTRASTSAVNELSTPVMPGASRHSINPEVSPSSFDNVRQIFRVDVIPVVEPFNALSSGALSNLDLASTQPFDVAAIRRDFPILQQKVNGHDLIWLDNAATTQKPQSVIDRLSHFYKFENSNIHRAAHELAARSTDAYEAARESVRRFLNAPSVNEVIFVRGATEAINLVAQSWGRQNIQKDDEIVITWLEHHANIVPWQMLCAEKGARLRVAPVDDHGQILLNEYERLLGPRTKLVALTQVSNALGTVTPFEEMIEAAHRHGARVLVDGAQAVSHMQIDVQQYDCDFYVLSGHKLFAPTGIGVLFGKTEVLNAMQPWQGGGNMIKDVTFERTTYQDAPFRFEAGTGNIADAVGLGAAVEYLERIGMVNIARHENELLTYGTAALKSIPGLHMIGNAAHKAGILSFVLDGFRNEDVSSALNQQGIAVRAGHHCAQPILRRFGVEGTVRPSLALYNTCEDIDALIAAIWNLRSGRTVGLLH